MEAQRKKIERLADEKRIRSIQASTVVDPTSSFFSRAKEKLGFVKREKRPEPKVPLKIPNGNNLMEEILRDQDRQRRRNNMANSPKGTTIPNNQLPTVTTEV